MQLLLRREEGQGLAEYALILAMIAILCIGALGIFGGALSGLITTIGNTMP